MDGYTAKGQMASLNRAVDDLMGVRRQLEAAVEDQGINKNRHIEDALEKFEVQVGILLTQTKGFARAMRRRIATTNN
jgi:hypothetical protein